MRITTYNFRRHRHWSHVIDAFAPDIILAQECGDTREGGLAQDSQATTFWRAANDYDWGTAVYARTGKVSSLEFEKFSGWQVGVEIEGLRIPWLAGRRLRVVSLHVPPPSNRYAKTVMNMLDAVEAFRGDADLILGGDFNLKSLGQRHESEKKADGTSWTTEPEEQEILTRLYESFGLVNCWQIANPSKPLAQTLRWSRNPVPPFHCDGIFVPKSWRTAMQSCEVKDSDWQTPGAGGAVVPRSDHNPVIATFAESQ